MANIFRQPCDEGVIRSRPINVPCSAGAEPGTYNADERARAELNQAIDESFVFGFRLVMLTSAGLALVSAFVAFRVIGNR